MRPVPVTGTVFVFVVCGGCCEAAAVAVSSVGVIKPSSPPDGGTSRRGEAENEIESSLGDAGWDWERGGVKMARMVAASGWPLSNNLRAKWMRTLGGEFGGMVDLR